MTSKTKTSTSIARETPKAVVQIGWHRYLIDLKDVQGLIEILHRSSEIERDYTDGESYSYISGRPQVTISTINEEIEPEKRPKVEKAEAQAEAA